MVIAEGLASYILLIRDFINTLPIAEQRHTRYDRDLGWVNRASLYIRDMYGRGVYLRTNVQGFRNDHDIAMAVPVADATIDRGSGGRDGPSRRGLGRRPERTEQAPHRLGLSESPRRI